MTARLGIRQLERLRGLGTRGALVVPDKISRSLVRRGLCTAEPNGSFSRITAAGLRALADAIDAGRIDLHSFNSANGAQDAEPRRK